MNQLKKKLKAKSSNKNTSIEDMNNSHIQPFTQTPSLNHTGENSAARIDGHDLFARYTVDVLKEDTVFFR